MLATLFRKNLLLLRGSRYKRFSYYLFLLFPDLLCPIYLVSFFSLWTIFMSLSFRISATFAKWSSSSYEQSLSITDLFSSEYLKLWLNLY